MNLGTERGVMPRPVSRRMATVERDLRARGCTLETGGWTTIARDASTALTVDDAPLALISLSEGRPLSVVSAVANATQRGHVPVLITDPETRSAVRDILSSPFALAGEDGDTRQFYAVEDRIRLTDDTFACVDTDGGLQWAEASTTAGTDSPPVHLTAGDDVVAVLDSVDELTCPGPDPDAFPTRYTRSDSQFRVFDHEGPVATYGTVRSMRADGYRPVALPLIPEHHVREHAPLARTTLLAVPDDGGVTYGTVL